MSVAEVVGLLLTAGLFGGAVGAAAVAWGTTRRQRTQQERTQLRDAYARWLAGHMTLSRASVSFVAAFRSLAAETRDSIYFSLRVEEVQRARASWGDAMRELDLAEASFRAHVPSPMISEQLARFKRVEPEALRTAINGSERDADQFVQTLRAADQAAIQFVEKAGARVAPPTRPYLAKSLMTKTAACVERIVDRWSEP